MNIKKYIFLAVGIICFVMIFFLYRFIFGKNIEINANDQVSIITNNEDWSLGDSQNIDISSIPGSVVIDNKTVDYSLIDLSGLNVTSDHSDEDAINLIDGLTEGDGGDPWTTNYVGGVHGEPYDPPLEIAWWQIDLTETVNGISKVWIDWSFGAETFIKMDYSVNGTDYFEAFDEWGFWVDGKERVFPSSVNARYLKLIVVQTAGDEIGSNHNIWEFKAYTKNAEASITTAATQIDGQEGSEDKDVIEWTSFTPTQTTPANTSISYEFRTSDDGSSWTSWSAPQTYSGSPLDLTTLTPNRYLQVKATLSNTDGVSTPQIDDYTINFHNNQKPNKPVAQTAVIGN